MPTISSRRSHLHRGASLHRKGNATAAAQEYRLHLTAYPGDKTAHYHLALALQHCGETDAAACSYAKALAIDPYYPEALNNLGILLHAQGKLDAARICFARALAARPGYTDAEYNYATTESDAGDYQAALLHFSQVLEREPKRADAWTNLSKVFLALRRPAEAQRAAQLALLLQPALKDAAWNHSVATLTMGQLPEGWNGFEHRSTPRHSSIPQWKGESLIGKRLLVHAEQGIGDTIHFYRYCSQVQADHIVFECHPELIPLFGDSIESIPFGAPLPKVDFQIPLMSLPQVFGTSLSTIPTGESYLQANPKLVALWNSRLVLPGHSLQVGVVWAGNPQHRNDRNRSIPPAFLQTLAAVENVAFCCLQQPPPALLPLSFAAIFDQLTWPDTAAILMNLDLVISADTAVAHLAGALGRPVWTLLPYAPDWRWMLDRGDTPWYPSMRLFRQPRMNDWGSVLAEVAATLRQVPFDR